MPMLGPAEDAMKIKPVSMDRLCIHQVSLMQSGYQESIEVLARHGVTKTALWKDKLDEVGAEQGRRILDDNGVEAVSLCAGGFLTEPTELKRQSAMDRNKHMLDQAYTVGAKSMVTITGGLNDGNSDLQYAREMVTEELSRLLTFSNDAGVLIALEPLHPMVCGLRSVISTLSEANEIVDSLESPAGLGIALDSYALWWDTNLYSEIERAGQRIINLHVSDWLTDTADVRLDRGMPGDGLINNRLIRQWVEQHGFAGPVEVEIFSAENWWKKPPDEVTSTIVKTSAGYL